VLPLGISEVFVAVFIPFRVRLLSMTCAMIFRVF